MSQQSIQFLSSETETYRKQQPACAWPRLSSDLFKEAIHFLPKERAALGSNWPQHRDVLVGFLSERVTGALPGHGPDCEAPVLQPLFSTNAFESFPV